MITMQNGKFTLQLSHQYNASKERVFQAWTNKEELEHWWGPEGFTTTIDQMEVVEGGHYRFIMKGPNGLEKVLTGRYVEIVANEKLVFTWKWEDDANDMNETLVSIEFVDREMKTELVVSHENFPTEAAAENHNYGWNSSLEGNFKKYIG